MLINIIHDNHWLRSPAPAAAPAPAPAGNKGEYPTGNVSLQTILCWYLRPHQGLSATDEELMGELTLDELKMAFRFEEE